MPYSYLRVVAKDANGVEVKDASIMEGDECLGRTGGDKPLPFDPRVYFIHVVSQALKSEERRLVLQPNRPDQAPTEIFIVKAATIV